jgi:SAM-dependent methyltransferase
VAEDWLPALDFPAYLEAKVAVDEASLNPGLLARFRGLLEAEPSPRLLDLGTGTGAMLRRVLGFDLRGDPLLCGLDLDPAGLELAASRITEKLESRGFRVSAAGLEAPDASTVGVSPAGMEASGEQAAGTPASHRLVGQRDERRIEIRLAAGDLLEPGALQPLAESRFGFLTAHAFFDLLPLDPAHTIIRGLLRSGGVLYATINYEGATSLLPPHADEAFEEALLAAYDRSMEERRVGGAGTGGAHSGRRLYGTLVKAGFEVLGAGSSDWNVLPDQGRHGPGPTHFLEAILGLIAAEGLRSAFEAEALRRWYSDRIADVQNGRLGLVTHQLDLLATRH